MAQRVVDFLELVEVQAEHRDQFLRPTQARSHLLQPLGEQHPVRQACQRVVVCHVLDALLAAAPLGDVVEGGHPATAR